MKKLSVLFLACCAISFFSCESESKIKELSEALADAEKELDLYVAKYGEMEGGEKTFISDPCAVSVPCDSCPGKSVNICCDATLYPQLTREQLESLLKNYRDRDWRFTSGVSSTATEEEIHALMHSGSTALDARYMDIDLNTLENYICRVKSSDEFLPSQDPELDSLQCINVLRFYYIKYPQGEGQMHSMFGDVIPANYANKHSLAIVPVKVSIDETRDEVSRQAEFLEITNDGITGSAIYSGVANHNRLCPPFTGCYGGKRLIDADPVEIEPWITLEYVDHPAP